MCLHTASWSATQVGGSGGPARVVSGSLLIFAADVAESSSDRVAGCASSSRELSMFVSLRSVPKPSHGVAWLMRGAIEEKSMVSLRTDAECSSSSPDQTRIAY